MSSLSLVYAGLGATLLGVVAFVSFNQGQISATSGQDAANLGVYEDVINAIQDETVDPDDPNAVLAELCKRAGIPADDERCIVHRD